MKRRLAKCMALVLAAGLLAGCGSGNKGQGSADRTDSGMQIGFVTGTGGLGDKNLNDASYEGLKGLEAEGVKINVVEAEESSDYANLQTLFAETGEYQAIFCISYEQVDALEKVSKDFPDQKFVLVDGTLEADNVASVLFRAEETGFQLGVLAGLLEKENALPFLNEEQRVGFVGGQDSPIINQFAAGYVAGVKLSNPEAEVDIAYVGSFSDPSKAIELSNGLYENGSDIVFACAGGSGLGVFASAEKKNAYAFGIETNQNDNAPDNIIASGVRRWDVVMQDIGKKAIDGSLKGGIYTYGLKEKSLEIGYENSNVEVSGGVKAEVDSYMERVVLGELVLPVTLEEVDAFLEKE